MASRSALKMAALLVLALFAGQLLMATPTVAIPGDTTCTDPTKCNIECFRIEFAKCIIFPRGFPIAAFCEGFAFARCSVGCKYWSEMKSNTTRVWCMRMHLTCVSTIFPCLWSLSHVPYFWVIVHLCISLYFQSPRCHTSFYVITLTDLSVCIMK